MAELATIARPYAEALFKSDEAGSKDASTWLEQLSVIAGNEQLRQFADNPKTSVQQVFDLVSGLVQGQLPAPARNFLQLLIENGRLGVLPLIAEQFRALKNARLGSADAAVHSAFPIEEAALADLSAALEKRFGRKLNLSVVLEPELIGGIRVVVGDEVLDTSVRARLQQMKVALTA
jgi:F-type H+-transporting ATPase subunit delta